MCYSSFVFSQSPLWELAPTAPIDSFHWEREGFSRPRSFAKLCAVKNQGILARLWSFEENPRCVFTERDEPVYRDSCCELFLSPVADEAGYMNFEINPRGVFLSQFGKARENRVFIKELTLLEPKITPFTLEEDGGVAWGCEIFIPDSLISELYGVEFRSSPCKIKGNFYKCADDSAAPHYGAHFPVTCAALGFHNPACFGSIILNDYNSERRETF